MLTIENAPPSPSDPSFVWSCFFWVPLSSATRSARSPAVKLIKAEYICNPRLVKRFETLQGQHHDHKVVYLFHGTGKQNSKEDTPPSLDGHAAKGPRHCQRRTGGRAGTTTAVGWAVLGCGW